MTDTSREPFERRVGTTLKGKWKLERLLGVGGMAAVYVGVHKIGRRDAIKILHPEVARNKDLRARFEQEAHAVNRFKHPGAVEIRDIDVSDEGAPFLVMELLEGEPLSERARRTDGVAMGELLRLTDELLDVLAAAHEQGIIHRDIKLDNLFVTEDGRLKVLDFGIARMRDGAPKTLNTRTGATLGTVPYMSPEQVKGLTIDGRVDIFAVGATMFRLIGKRRIHEARTESELLVKMATQAAPGLALIAPETPEPICLVVDRALAFQRERRYPDAKTMQIDVRAVRNGSDPPFAKARLAQGDRPDELPPVRNITASPLVASASRSGPSVASSSGAEPTIAAPLGPSVDASAVVNLALADLGCAPASSGSPPGPANAVEPTIAAAPSSMAHSVLSGAVASAPSAQRQAATKTPVSVQRPPSTGTVAFDSAPPVSGSPQPVVREPTEVANEPRAWGPAFAPPSAPQRGSAPSIPNAASPGVMPPGTMAATPTPFGLPAAPPVSLAPKKSPAVLVAVIGVVLVLGSIVAWLALRGSKDDAAAAAPGSPDDPAAASANEARGGKAARPGATPPGAPPAGAGASPATPSPQGAATAGAGVATPPSPPSTSPRPAAASPALKPTAPATAAPPPQPATQTAPPPPPTSSKGKGKEKGKK
jgi:serine/threonine-protein kinase